MLWVTAMGSLKTGLFWLITLWKWGDQFWKDELFMVSGGKKGMAMDSQKLLDPFSA